MSKALEYFVEDLMGVTPEEVGALITGLMQPEFKKYSNTNGSKRVERWEGNIMGIPVQMTAVTMHPGSSWSKTDYKLETPEWDVSVLCYHEPNAALFDDKPKGQAKINGKPVTLFSPYMEGDEDTYRHQMTLLKLASGMYL